MFDIITDTYLLTATKNGKFMLKVFDPKYFNVVAFMLDKASYDSLYNKLSNREFIHVRCFYNFRSVFGNLVSVASEDTGEVYYSVS